MQPKDREMSETTTQNCFHYIQTDWSSYKPIPWPESSRKPFKCPACDGYGERENEGEAVACRPCSNTGIVWG